MSHWNFRAIHFEEHGQIWYAIHEVFYDDDHTILGAGANPIPVIGETPMELLDVLERMKRACAQPALRFDGDKLVLAH